ncbi:patatin-like protein [Kitasatospora sp. HPMI-4]|uniref:patatin-like protein n=1 Tax=Kitasatospora sp. HPMI-4 TaxID=3448443 RepID=UPI003F1D7F61
MANTTNGDAEPAGSAAGDPDFDRQEIRLAVVLNGGVSLAVWMSGVTLELHHLARARRWNPAAYRPLLDLLQADARVDVIAGTSAGGINGAFLALGLAHDRDLTAMRDLWRADGSMEKLLRSPLRKDPPSLLMGDEYFLPALTDALERVLASPPPGGPSGNTGAEPVELILTGTLWEGRTTSFTDDMGTGITEVDHDATFRFATPLDGTGALGDLADGTVVEQLANAARCTSSFPGAFEPHWVGVTGPRAAGGAWPSTAGGTDFGQSQYVLDGGVLLNKPIRPALEAVYRQSVGVQVRRVLAYVVPDPAETTALPADVPTPENLPHARDALLGALTRLRSTDSVSRELTEIRTRNEAVHLRRRARDRLAAAMAGSAEDLSERAWEGYVEVRVGNAARIIAGLIEAGQTTGEQGWSRRELADRLEGLLLAKRGEEGSFIPADPLDTALTRTGEDWDWGLTTVERLADMAVDVLRRAVLLSPMGSPQRREIVRARSGLSRTLEDIRQDRRALDEYWAGAPGRTTLTAPDGRVHRFTRMPVREPDGLGAAGGEDGLGTAGGRDGLGEAGGRDGLGRWLDQVLDGWVHLRSRDGSADRRQRQYRQACALAAHLRACRGAIADVIGIPQALESQYLESRRLAALHDYLFGPEREPVPGPAPHLLRRMLRLDVVQLAFSGASQEVEQEVELVQFSSTSPQLLTGKQLHHFGAFYRQSWRVNDWLHGRMDGAAHIVRMLLSPDRLRQCAAVPAADGPASAERTAELRRRQVEDLLGLIRECALATGPEGAADREWLAKRWELEDEKECRLFVESIVTVVPRCAPRAPHAPSAPGGACVPGTPGLPAAPQAPNTPAAPAGSADPPQGGGASDDALATTGAGAVPGPAAAGLQACVRAVRRSVQTAILREEIDALAESIRGEAAEDRTEAGRIWLDRHHARKREAGGVLRTDDLWELWQAAEGIGRDRIPGDVGSDTFARTAAHAAAVAANTATAAKPGRPAAASAPGPRGIKAVGVILAAFRGYTLAVWGMVLFLTRRSRSGTRAVELAVAAGGVLLACALFVPGLPMVFTLAGVLLLLAGASAAALLTRGARGVGGRLAALAALVAAALGYLTWEWVHRSHVDAESVLIRIGVGALVVLAGWWVARSQREPGNSRRRRERS